MSQGDESGAALDFAESQYAAQVTKRDGEVVNYEAITDALKEVRENGGVLKLLQDQEFVSDQTFKSGINATIDLNGHRLSASTTSSSAYAIAVKQGAKLVIADTSEEGSGVLGKGSIRRFIGLEGELDLEGGVIDNDFATCSKSSIEVKGADAVLNINGGTVRYSANSTAYSAVSLTKGAVNLNAGSIESDTGTAVNISNAAAFNMNGGSISGFKNGISITNAGATVSLARGTVNAISMGSGTLVLGDASPASAGDLIVDSLAVSGTSSTPTILLNSGSLETFISSSSAFRFSGDSAFSSAMVFADESVAAYLPGGFKLVQSGDIYIVQSDTLDAAVELQHSDGGVKQYASMGEAFSDFQSGDTFKILQDVDLSNNAGLLIKGAYNNKLEATIDLNGHNIKAANNDSSNIRVGYATLTIKDESADEQGRIYSESPYEQGVNDKALISVVGGKVVLESGTIDASTSFENPKIQGQSAVGVYWDGDPGQVVVKGGTIKAGWYCITGNGSASDNPDNDKVHASTNVVINSGSLVSDADYAIYNPQIGSVEVNGGDICGAVGGIMMNRGTLNVAGGTIVSKGASLADASGDGTSGASAAVINVNAEYGNASAIVSAGKFIAESGASVFAIGAKNAATIAISGGEFSEGVPEAYCAEGYVPTSSIDGSGATTYGVVKAPARIVDASGNVLSSHATLQEAVNASEAGQTIKLLADMTESVVVDGEGAVNLDLNGKTLTAADDVAIRVEGKGNLYVHDFTSTNPNVDGANVSGYVGGKVIASKYAVEAVNGGRFTLESGMIESTNFHALLSQGDTTGNGTIASCVSVAGGYVLAQEGALHIKGKGAEAYVTGGVLEAKDNAVIMGNGTVQPGTDNGGTVIRISGGKLVGHIQTEGYIACGVYHPQSGTLSISGGSIYADGGVGVLMRAGDATIAGGTIQTTGTTSGWVGDKKSSISCSGVYVDGAAAYPGMNDGGLNAMVAGPGTSIVAGSKEVPALVLTNGDSASVKGGLVAAAGTYSSDVSDYVSAGSVCVPTSDGKYTVVSKGETSEPEVKPGEGSVSGSVAIGGDSVKIDGSDQKQIADSAAAAAGSLKKDGVVVDSESNTAKIGDVTVDTSAEGAASAIETVGDKATEEGSSVDVKLVVKADTGAEANAQITEQASKSQAEVIPFALSVDMVTEVKDANGAVVASAAVPVKETTEAIKVTIAVDPAKIKDKNVMVARVHDDVVELITPESVNYETGDVVFETGKFSDYAVLTSERNQSYDLANYTNADGSRKGIDNADFNKGADVAFAGWYKDAACTQPYGLTDKSGTAYPKFVPVSELITFKGGSLRMDGAEPAASTSLRFGYEMHLPEGASIQSWYWNWSVPAKETSGTTNVDKYWAIDGNGVIANIVFEDVAKANYSVDVKVQHVLGYTTADGTSVVVEEPVWQTRTVKQVAASASANGFASNEEKEYANAILENC